MGLLPIPFFGAGVTVGASASIFGFLGALVHYGRRTGSSHIGRAGIQYAVFMGIMGFIFPGVDNAAHLGGFVGGYLASMILDPLKKERIDHILIAVGCLVVTLRRDRRDRDLRAAVHPLSHRFDADSTTESRFASIGFGVRAIEVRSRR